MSMNTKSKKCLVVYESKHGSVAEVANFIGEQLRKKEHVVDVLQVDEVIDLSQYQMVVVGSPIRYDTWMPGVREFVQSNEQVLATKSVFYFFVCLTLSNQNPKALRNANAYATKIKALTPSVHVQSFGQFAGVLDYSKMTGIFRVIAKLIMAVLGVKEGDYRDWDKIEEWVDQAVA